MCIPKTTPSLSQHSELPSPGLQALWLGTCHAPRFAGLQVTQLKARTPDFTFASRKNLV